MPGAEPGGGIEEGHIVGHPRFGDDPRRVGGQRGYAAGPRTKLRI